MSDSQSYRARWIFPTNGDPIRDGYVTVVTGRVVEMGTAVPTGAIDLGDIALTAGFVNAHTHLDLSLAPRPLARPSSFTDWLMSIVDFRRNSSGEAVSAIAAGIDELLRTGTTLVGDIGASEFSESCLEEAGLWAVVYREVVGLKRMRYEPLMQSALFALETRQNREAVRTGVSPHAPYSTAREAYEQIGELPERTAVATHWLESSEEIEFLQNRSGPMLEFLDRFGALPPEWECPADLTLQYLGGKVAWLLVHVNYLSDEQLDLLSKMLEQHRLAGVVFCPRTHDWFAHTDHPWHRLMDRKIPVALGTDSRATSPDLSVFAEAQFLFANDANAEPRVLLEMLTKTGARVLGFDEHCGQLREGRRADLAAVFLPEQNTSDPYELLFDPRSHPVGTMLNGFWVYDPAN